jgi:DNA-binding winged helix-turn-helix (wHTH) protein/HAMP domain-containing protein
MKVPGRTIKFISRVYLSFLLVLALTILSIGSVAWVVAGNQIMLRAERTLDQSLQNSEFDFEQEESDLTTLGNWLVAQREFVSLARARDSIGLARMLEPLTLTGIVDTILVVDSTGQEIVRVTENKPITQGGNSLILTGIKEALSGKSTYGVEPDEFGELRGRFTLPIYDEVAQPPIGVLVVGFFFDGPILRRMSSGPANQAIIVYDDRVAITNVTEGNGDPWIGQPVPEEITRAEREGRPSGIVPFDGGSDKYLFKFRPLHFPTSTAVGMYGVGISSLVVESERNELFLAMGGWIFLIALAISALAYVIARSVSLPVQKVAAAVRGIADGNLSEPIPPVRDDELGDLVDGLQIIMERLRAAFQPASVEGKPLACGEIVLEPRSHRVSVSGKLVGLSTTEFKLLRYLMINHDAVVSISLIITNVWGYAGHEDDDVVRMAISRLRKKIERNPSLPTALVTVPGAGYMLKSKP